MIVIGLENLDTLQFNARSDYETRTIEQLQAQNTILLLKILPDLPLCLNREQLNDPRSNMWRGIAADIINAAAFYSIRKTQILGYAEDRVVSLGLSCMSIALSMLLAVHHVFDDIRSDTSSEPRDVYRTVGCDNISQLTLSLIRFLEAMQECALAPPCPEELANQLTNTYGILLLFLIRCTLRSVFRYSRHGFEAVECQRNHDAFFVLGSSCPSYQPNLAVLEASTVTVAQTWPRDDMKDRKSMWLYTQCQRAAKLLAMPDGPNKTLGEHLEYSINQWLGIS